MTCLLQVPGTFTPGRLARYTGWVYNLCRYFYAIFQFDGLQGPADRVVPRFATFSYQYQFPRADISRATSPGGIGQWSKEQLQPGVYFSVAIPNPITNQG